jgi:hypothetical protein
MTVARTRIRRFRPHGSALWVAVLHQPDELARGSEITLRVADMCKNFKEPIAGFAIVVWDDVDRSACDWDIWANRIPHVLVADYLHERVKLEIYQDTTIRKLQDDGFI